MKERGRAFEARRQLADEHGFGPQSDTEFLCDRLMDSPRQPHDVGGRRILAVDEREGVSR